MIRRHKTGPARGVAFDDLRQVTRSWFRSTAGGTDVSEAAAKKIAKPMPASTSANRLRRLTEAGVRPQPFDHEEIHAPEASSMRNIAIFAPTITP